MQYVPIFKDRIDTGRALARDLAGYSGRRDAVVLALRRGGVPVANEVATVVNVPMDEFIVRKLGVPGQEGFGFGEIASGGVRFVNEKIVKALRMPEAMIEQVVEYGQAGLVRREKLYCGTRPESDLNGRTVIIVDDGLATGSTMRAAVTALKTRNPKKIVVAVPVASQQACNDFRQEADVLSVWAVTPEPFLASVCSMRIFRKPPTMK
jgi:Predicted phosphoribosyltransferases